MGSDVGGSSALPSHSIKGDVRWREVVNSPMSDLEIRHICLKALTILMCCTVISFESQPVADNTATLREWRIHRGSGYFERNGRERRTEEGVCHREVTMPCAMVPRNVLARPRHSTHPLFSLHLSFSIRCKRPRYSL